MKRHVFTPLGIATAAMLTFLAPANVTGNSLAPGLVARMTLASGATRTVTLEGVGCSEILCSRVAIRGRVEGDSRVTTAPLDSIAAIKDIRKTDALFLFRDGTQRRLLVVYDNRFLYFANQNGQARKLDLAGITSLEFLGATREQSTIGAGAVRSEPSER